MLILSLSWPPSVNHYWIAKGNRRFISRRGLAFRNEALSVVPHGFKTLEGRLSIEIDAYPPDKRVRDLDNILKSILDSLEFAKVYKTDNQVDEIFICRKEIAKPGRVTIKINLI